MMEECYQELLPSPKYKCLNGMGMGLGLCLFESDTLGLGLHLDSSIAGRSISSSIYLD